MSRIISGVAGGTSLKSVPGDATRPTTDRVKEALFSRLESWDVISSARVLDLFAGPVPSDLKPQAVERVRYCSLS